MTASAAIHLMRKRGSERIDLSHVLAAVEELNALRREIQDLECETFSFRDKIKRLSEPVRDRTSPTDTDA